MVGNKDEESSTEVDNSEHPVKAAVDDGTSVEQRSSIQQHNIGALKFVWALLVGAAIGIGIGAGIWKSDSSTETAQTSPFAYDPDTSAHKMKTNSYMPFM